MSDPQQPSPRRRATRLAVRVGVGVVVGVVAVGTVAAAAFVPIGDAARSAQSVTVEPASGDQQIACPGPVSRLSDDTGSQATKVSTVGAVTVEKGTNPDGSSIARSPLQQPDNSGRSGSSAASVLSAPTTAGDQRIVLSAAQSEQNANNDLVGFSASSCQEASLDSWLVGGATTTGRTSFLYLANPTQVDATVNLTIVGEQGPVDAPGARDLIVAAGSQRVLSLSGFAPNLTSPVVHVQSTGGAVAAWIQQSIVRGLAPGGFELTGSVGQPTASHIIPGLEIAGTTAIAEQLGKSAGNEDMQAVLRVYVPGRDATAMSVTAKSESIGVPDVTFNLGATGGLVTDFVLRDIPDGTYTMTVNADHPILAAARTSVVSGGAIDFSWFQSVAPQTAGFVIVAPPGPSPRLHLFNPGGTDATLHIRTPQGDTADLPVPAGAATGVPLGATVYAANSPVPLVASVGYLGNGQLSAFPLSPVSGLDGPVTVYPR